MKKFIILLPLCGLLVAWNNSHTAEVKTNTEKQAIQGKTEVDKALEQKIQRNLLKDNDLPIGTRKNIKVTVNNGRVILEGEVGTREEKNDLSHKIRETQGVRSVDDRITVKNDESNL